MTDIVERLRSPANVFYEYAADKGAMLQEAADEIDRLREIVKYYACDCDGHCDRTHDDCLINHAALGEKE